MGYLLVIWEGARPEDDEAGRRACDEMTGRYLDGERVEPSPRIRDFVASLARDWPDDPADPEWDRSLWEVPHLLEGASGPVLFLNIRMDLPVIASTVVAARAEECGLVTYDPQVGFLRPVSEKVIAAYERRWAGALN